MLMPKSVISVHLGGTILKKSPNHGGDEGFSTMRDV